MDSRRLVLLFDGTWNRPESGTSVQRLHRLIAPIDPAGVEATAGLALRVGSAFGFGLSGPVMEDYRWLCETWQP